MQGKKAHGDAFSSSPCLGMGCKVKGKLKARGSLEGIKDIFLFFRLEGDF
jgi:hypothetical protein